MTGPKSKSARNIALAVLNRFNPERNYAAPILNKLLKQTNEKQRATDLVFGTIRNRRAIDMVITRFTARPVKRIPAKTLNVIRIAVYELVYCPATAEYSIVNDAVENSKSVGGKKQAGFVNAALRQVARQIKNRQANLLNACPTKTLPQTLSNGCEFLAALLPEPKIKIVEYLSSVFSLPEWLIAGWVADFGAEKTREICFASNRKTSIYLRPNRLKTTITCLAEQLGKDGIDAEIVDNSMLKLESPADVTKLPGFAEGLFTVQDITASRILQLLQPRPGWTILDLCAAPGVKTTQLAELTDDKAKILATDIDKKRLDKVKENISRLGIKSVCVVEYENLRKAIDKFGLFDCIVLDVPCSNTGVLARRIESRYRITSNAIKQLAKIQMKLLQSAVKMLKPQGTICYSTCSIQRTENAELVRKFLHQNPEIELVSEKPFLPSAQETDHDGGYAAILAGK